MTPASRKIRRGTKLGNHLFAADYRGRKVLVTIPPRPEDELRQTRK